MTTICELDPEELNHQYWRSVEDEWVNSLPRFTDAFLLEVFGDVLETMDDKINELRKIQSKLIKTIYCAGKKYILGDDINSLFARFCIEILFMEDLYNVEKSLYLIQRLKWRKHSPKHTREGRFTDNDIESARGVSIVDLAGQQVSFLKKSGRNYVARCPFHEERTPSFYLYTESNSFHCFGCGAGGDVITFVQKALGVDFKGAIYYLMKN